MALDVFDIKLGGEKLPFGMGDDETKGLVAMKMLDAVQTVVDVLTDNDGKGGWKVTFDPGLNAYTNRENGQRSIVVSGKALLDAEPGTPLSEVAAILTGFAVHEVGHTKINLFREVAKRWPGKQLPITLANVIEDVVLEARTCEEYDGFADHGEGNIFRPALEWIAALSCPSTPLKWGGSTGHKVNVVGQMLRYRDFVTFDMSDAPTRDALDYVETWSQGITPNLTPKGCVALIEDILSYMKATSEPEPEPESEPEGKDGDEGEPEPGEGEGEGNGPGIPDEDDDSDDTEGDDADDGDDTEGEDGDGDSDDTEGDDGDGNGGDSDDGDSDTEGDSDGGDGDGDGEADDDGDGEGNPGTDGTNTDGDTGPVDTTERTEGAKGSTDQNGAGGSGQTIAEASDDDFLDDFEPDEVGKSWDDMASDGKDDYAQRDLARAEAEERVTTRMDAGIHGKMRVIFR